MDPDIIAYNLTDCWRLEGKLRVDILERAFSEDSRRHEMLRATFGAVDGKPVQIVSPVSSFALSKVEFRGRPKMSGCKMPIKLSPKKAAVRLIYQMGPFFGVR